MNKVDRRELPALHVPVRRLPARAAPGRPHGGRRANAARRQPGPPSGPSGACRPHL